MGDASHPVLRHSVLGRLAGMLFSLGAVASFFANMLFDPPVYGRAHATNALAFVSGVACFLIPWQRISSRWFHLLPILGACEVALTAWVVGVHGGVYSWFFVLVAVFIAAAIDDRRAIAAHTLFLCALAWVPVLHADAPYDALVLALVQVPVLVAVIAIVTGLREALTARERTLEALVSTDPLTGVGNLRLLQERLAYELARHGRAGRSLVVLLLDLDRFKEVNDTLGHPVGDVLLRDVAAVLCETVRQGDTVVRQGGDEFCILTPETGAADAAELVDRLRDALAGLTAIDAPLSASMGYAVFPDDGTTAEALMARADLGQRMDKAGRRELAGRREAALRS